MKIKFYPYGGVSSFQTKMNVCLKHELLVLVMGPLAQILAFYIFCFFLRPQDILILENYHYGILFFNLLPVYPLDGGKLVSIIFAFFLPFKKSLNITFKVSFSFLFLLFCFCFSGAFSLNLVLMSLLLFAKLWEERNKLSLYYQKFLLERYLEPVSFSKRKIIIDEEDMYRDRKHLFFFQHRYYTEQEFLKKRFKKTTIIDK